MNKKIISLIIALTLPVAFLTGCKKSKEEVKEKEFYMTEDTTALDGNVEYSARTYKEAFYSTENYSDEFLQEEFNTIIDEIESTEEKDDLIELLEAYTSSDDSDLSFIKTCYDKYNVLDDEKTTLTHSPLYEISNRLYKSTLNATKKHYDINDFYIYYKKELKNSDSSEEDLENKIRITAIKEFTLANIYKSAYNDSFISEIITSLNTEDDDEEKVEENKKDEVVVEKPSVDSDNDETTDNEDNETYPEFVDLTETVKSQIYDAGVNSAIEFISKEYATTPSQFARGVYDAIEHDNPLGDKKEEGYLSFLDGFKTTLINNGVEFN